MNNDYAFFIFLKCSIYYPNPNPKHNPNARSTQSHTKNIIWNTNFTSNQIFLINLAEHIAIKFTSFLELHIKFIDKKRERFIFGITSSKASKTRSHGLQVEEANVATVVTMNQGRDILFLNNELLFLHHSGCSISNEYIPPGTILVEVPSPKHSL